MKRRLRAPIITANKTDITADVVLNWLVTPTGYPNVRPMSINTRPIRMKGGCEAKPASATEKMNALSFEDSDFFCVSFNVSQTYALKAIIPAREDRMIQCSTSN